VSGAAETRRIEVSRTAATRLGTPTCRPSAASAVASVVRAFSRSSCALPSVTSERSESDRVAVPLRSLFTETFSCSWARRTLASRTRTSSAAARAAKYCCFVVRAT
jgi:hypothetical protein